MERFIDVEVEREPPWDILGRLREIDPMAELVYLGKGRWWLGVVKLNSPRREIAQKVLNYWADKGIENSQAVVRTEILKSQGFGRCATIRSPDGCEPDWGFIVEDFRRTTWAVENWGSDDPVIQQQLEDSVTANDRLRMRTRAATLERVGGDYRYLIHRALRNSVSVTVGANIS